MLNKILVIVTIFCSLATLGVYVYTNIIYKRPLPNNDLLTKQLEDETRRFSISDSYKLDKMTINLTSKTKRLRFLDVQMYFVPLKNHYVTQLESDKAYIKDSIIEIVGFMTPNELNSVSGKLILEERIKKKIRKRFDRAIIKEIYFSKFVVQ